jgi:hypothetical protein
MQMSQDSYVMVLVTTGFLGGLSWTILTTVCFKVVRKALGCADGVARPTGLVDLFGHLLGVAGSGAYFLAFILVAARWTNRYPQWSSSKDVLWIGIVAGAALLQMQKRRRS